MVRVYGTEWVDQELTLSRTICQKNLEAERRRVARVVEEMPKRFIKQKDELPRAD